MSTLVLVTLRLSDSALYLVDDLVFRFLRCLVRFCFISYFDKNAEMLTQEIQKRDGEKRSGRII